MCLLILIFDTLFLNLIFSYVYYGDRGAYLPPKEHLPKYGRLLNGLYGISEVPLDSK